MIRHFSAKRPWFRTIAALLVCLLVFNDCSFAVHAGDTRAALNATLRTNPVVKINSRAGLFSISDDTDQILSILKAFKDDFAFGYVSVLIGDAITSGIGSSGLAFFISDNLPEVSTERFDFSRVTKDGGTFLVPYMVPGIERELKLRYADRSDKDARFPADIVIGDVAVTIEGLPRGEESSREYGDIDLVIAELETEEKLQREALPKVSSGEEDSTTGGADLDRGTVLQAILLSLIYLYWKVDPTVYLSLLSSELLIALAVSIVVHEGIHILQILLMGKRASYLSTRIGSGGIEVKFQADSEGVAKTIILAGMVGSGALSTVFSVASVFFDGSFFVLMGILNATFALAGRDLSNLQKGTDFKGAPRKFLRAVKTVLGDFFRDRKSPVIILMGGYFASGKSLIANKVKMHLKDKLHRKVFVVGGDNWLLSNDRRKLLRGKPIYPYNKYEIDRWKDMVQRASESLPIFIPFYLTTFRSRLTLPKEEFIEAFSQAAPFSEDGYLLFYAGRLKDRPIRDFIAPGYLEQIFEGIDKNWSSDEDMAKNIRRRLELLLDRPITRYMIDPQNEVYVDAYTGDLIEKLPLGPEDILIMEFEQAISFPEINKLADIHAFVDASFLHRKEYFMGRRKHGERYADLAGSEAEERMLELLENEEFLTRKKAEADLVVYNDEKLEESVMHDVVRSRHLDRKKEHEEGDVESEVISPELVVRDFLDVARTKAYAAARKNEKILIAIDTSWVPDLQQSFVQKLVTDLQRLSEKGKMGGIVVVRGKGAVLCDEVYSALPKEGGFSNSNMIFLGEKELLRSDAFSEFRSGGKNSAFFAEITVPPSFPRTGYTGFMEMLTTSIKEALTGGKRVYEFVLKARPMDFDSLKEVYDRQAQFLISA